MPWVKFSDDWYDDGKLAGADPWVIAMWAVGVTWCARNLSDGIIPAGEHRRLLNLYGTFDSDGQQVHPDHVADELVARGSWQTVAGGYEVVNYHRYQPTREKVLSDRDRERQRKASARNPAGRDTESSDSPTTPVIPSPSPDGSLSSSSSSDLERLPADLWTTMADKKLRLAKGVTNPAAWKRKVVQNDQADPELVGRAVQLVERFELSTSQLADVLIDGTNPQWLAHCQRKASA